MLAFKWTCCCHINRFSNVITNETQGLDIYFWPSVGLQTQCPAFDLLAFWGSVIDSKNLAHEMVSFNICHSLRFFFFRIAVNMETTKDWKDFRKFYVFMSVCFSWCRICKFPLCTLSRVPVIGPNAVLGHISLINLTMHVNIPPFFRIC